MSIKNRHTTIGLIILFLLIIIDSFVVIRFFTNDKYNEVTYSKASLTDYNNIISTKIAKQNEPEVFVFENKDALKNTNDVKLNKMSETKVVEKSNNMPVVSSRASSSRKETEINNSTSSVETKSSIEPKSVTESATSNSTSSIPNNQNSIGTIQIPKTGVNLPILEKVTVKGMELAACYLYSTGTINLSGTTVIVGHNYNNGKLFSNNKNLGVGDTIIITANGITKSYTIYETLITTKEDISYLERNTSNEPQIALSTCTNYNDKRLVILAK